MVKPGAPLAEVIKEAPALTKDVDALIIVDINARGHEDCELLRKTKAKEGLWKQQFQ